MTRFATLLLAAVAVTIAGEASLKERNGDAWIWERGPDLPQARAGCAAAWVADRLVAAGGSVWEGDAKRPTNRVDACDPAAAKWEALPPLPEAVAYAAHAADEQALYLAGGTADTGATRACWRLARGEGGWSWSKLPDLPAARTYAQAAILDGRLYVAGGCSDPNDLSKTTTELLSLNLADAARGWEKRALLPAPGRCRAALVADEQALYLFGGSRLETGRGVVDQADALRYDPRRDRWSRLPAMPRALRGFSAALLEEGLIGLFGGYSGPPDAMTRLGPAYGYERRVLVYDPRARRYHEATPLPRAVADMPVVLHAGVLYGAGGEDSARSRSSGLWMGRPSPTGSPAPDTLTILALGDSVTAGAGRSGVVEAESYPRLLERRLAWRGLRTTVINSGAGGETTAGALQRLPSVVAPLPRINIAVVMYGLNDAAMVNAGPQERATPRVPLTEYRSNLHDLIAELRRQGAQPIVCTPNPMTSAYEHSKVGAYARETDINFQVRRYAAAAREVAKAEKVRVVDTFDLFAHDPRRDALLPDGLHPGPAGQELIAEAVERAIAPIDRGGSAPNPAGRGAPVPPTEYGGKRRAVAPGYPSLGY